MSHRSMLTICAGIMAFGFFAATPSWQPEHEQQTHKIIVPPDSDFRYGIQSDPQRNASASVKDVKALGLGWVKWSLRWSEIERERADFDWGWWDERINIYNAEGVKILLTITATPRWARPANAHEHFDGPPSEVRRYADFVAAVARRYEGKVDAIEIWNEQNLHYAWGGEPPNAKHYMDLLCQSYAAIKAVNPGLVVVSGGLTPTGAPLPMGVDDVLFFQQMYSSGLKGCSDAVGAHAPNAANPPDLLWDPTDRRFAQNHHSYFFRNTLEEYRRVMTRNDDEDKRIWVTEFGWAACCVSNGMLSISPDQQAEYSLKAFQMGKAWGWVGAMFLANLDYGLTQPSSLQAAFSLLQRGGRTLAYDELKTMWK